MEVDVFGVKYN